MGKTWLTDCTSNIGSTISQTVALRQEIKYEITKKEMIVKSLTDTILGLVRSIFVPISSSILHKAWCQQSEKKKSDRREYEFVKDEMIESFFNGNKKKAHLEHIVMCGDDIYAYNIVFKFDKISFQITYPCPDHIRNDNHLVYTDYGKYILRYKANDACWDWITSSYKEEDIAKAIEKFVSTERN